MTLYFLTLEDAISLHQKAIDQFGGLSGIRSKNLLDSALAQPPMTFSDEFVYKSIYEMAAAYTYCIIKNHPFLDGNKRAGILVALVFLEKNGHSVNIPADKLYNLALGIAESRKTIEDIAQFFEKYST